MERKADQSVAPRSKTGPKVEARDDLKATLIAVYGVFMTPLGWRWALFVWGYALAWFLLNDRVKWLGYRFFDGAGAKTPAVVTAHMRRGAHGLS